MSLRSQFLHYRCARFETKLAHDSLLIYSMTHRQSKHSHAPSSPRAEGGVSTGSRGPGRRRYDAFLMTGDMIIRTSSSEEYCSPVIPPETHDTVEQLLAPQLNAILPASISLGSRIPVKKSRSVGQRLPRSLGQSSQSNGTAESLADPGAPSEPLSGDRCRLRQSPEATPTIPSVKPATTSATSITTSTTPTYHPSSPPVFDNSHAENNTDNKLKQASNIPSHAHHASNHAHDVISPSSPLRKRNRRASDGSASHPPSSRLQGSRIPTHSNSCMKSSQNHSSNHSQNNSTNHSKIYSVNHSSNNSIIYSSKNHSQNPSSSYSTTSSSASTSKSGIVPPQKNSYRKEKKSYSFDNSTSNGSLNTDIAAPVLRTSAQVHSTSEFGELHQSGKERHDYSLEKSSTPETDPEEGDYVLSDGICDSDSGCLKLAPSLDAKFDPSQDLDSLAGGDGELLVTEEGEIIRPPTSSAMSFDARLQTNVVEAGDDVAEEEVSAIATDAALSPSLHLSRVSSPQRRRPKSEMVVSKTSLASSLIKPLPDLSSPSSNHYGECGSERAPSTFRANSYDSPCPANHAPFSADPAALPSDHAPPFSFPYTQTPSRSYNTDRLLDIPPDDICSEDEAFSRANLAVLDTAQLPPPPASLLADYRTPPPSTPLSTDYQPPPLLGYEGFYHRSRRSRQKRRRSSDNVESAATSAATTDEEGGDDDTEDIGESRAMFHPGEWRRRSLTDSDSDRTSTSDGLRTLRLVELDDEVAVVTPSTPTTATATTATSPIEMTTILDSPARASQDLAEVRSVLIIDSSTPSQRNLHQTPSKDNSPTPSNHNLPSQHTHSSPSQHTHPAPSHHSSPSQHSSPASPNHNPYQKPSKESPPTSSNHNPAKPSQPESVPISIERPLTFVRRTISTTDSSTMTSDLNLNLEPIKLLEKLTPESQQQQQTYGETVCESG